jgi:hypothetical protein
LPFQFRRAIYQRLENNHELVGFRKYPAIPNFILAKLKSVQEQNLPPKKFNYALSRNFEQEPPKEHGTTALSRNYLQNGTVNEITAIKSSQSPPS